MFHVCSLQLMVNECSFNDYHRNFTYELKLSLLHLSSCQSIVISSLISSSSVTKDDFINQIINLQEAFKLLCTAYIATFRLQVKYVLEFKTTIQSEDYLSHAFFLFQIGTIVQLLTQIMTNNNWKKHISKISKKNTINLKEQLKLQWPRLLSSLKSMVIIGVGLIFVLVSRLAAAFENGQWILVTLCMTQGDSVGEAFTTTKIRLMGTLPGTLTICRQSIISMHSIYDQLFHHNHSRESIIRLELEQQKIESFIDVQRSCFHHLISLQRTLVEHASLEPTFWWINNNFSTKYYNVLIQQQINIFKMLHNIDATLMRINEYSQRIEHLQLDAADGHFPPNLHRGFSDLSRQLNDCFHLSIS
ncbi:unnamed protein product, partial [Rotaria sordida]